MDNFNAVREFHRVFGLTSHDAPVYPSEQDVELRHRLLDEEVNELHRAMDTGGLKDIAKELADVLYVTYGLAVTYGIDANRVFAEVHRSNMSKLTADGQVLRRGDGKVLKSDQYCEADMTVIYG